jgi:hypothetical protein
MARAATIPCLFDISSMGESALQSHMKGIFISLFLPCVKVSERGGLKQFSWLGTDIFTWRKVRLRKVSYMKMLRKRCLKTVIFVLESPWFCSTKKCMLSRCSADQTPQSGWLFHPGVNESNCFIFTPDNKFNSHLVVSVFENSVFLIKCHISLVYSHICYWKGQYKNNLYIYTGVFFHSVCIIT